MVYLGSKERINNLIKQQPNLKGIEFKCLNFLKEPINAKNCLIYCDPPYKGTTKYKDNFDHNRFYNVCRELAKDNTFC